MASGALEPSLRELCVSVVDDDAYLLVLPLDEGGNRLAPTERIVLSARSLLLALQAGIADTQPHAD